MGHTCEEVPILKVHVYVSFCFELFNPIPDGRGPPGRNCELALRLKKIEVYHQYFDKCKQLGAKKMMMSNYFF